MAAIASIFGPYSPNTVGTGWSGFNLRIRVKSYLLHRPAKKIRLSLMGISGYTWAFTDCFIGYRATSGDDYDFESTPTRVTFNGGNNGASVTASGLDSDPITFYFDPDKDIVVSFYFNDPSYDDIPRTNDGAVSGVQCYHYYGSNEADQVNASSGYTAQNAGRLFCVARIDRYEELSLFYTFENISGTTLYDNSYSENNLTLSGGPEEVQGRIGRSSLYFTGGDLAYSDSHPGLTNDMAISLWVKFTSLGSNSSYYQIFGISDGTSNTGIVLCRTYGSARIHVGRSDSYSNKGYSIHNYNSASDGWTPELGVWYHVVYQYRTSDDHIELWVNGNSQISTTFNAFGSASGTGHPVSMGQAASGQMECILDHVKIFDLRGRSLLSSAEISALYKEGIQAQSWYDSDWGFRKRINLSGQSGAGADYQVLLKVGESSGASGYDFHLNGNSELFPSGKNDSGDLRFTLYDARTELHFWVEKVEGSSPNRTAYCWVKIPANLNYDSFIYCYYGNSSAKKFCNAEDTFIAVWNFNDGKVPSNFGAFSGSNPAVDSSDVFEGGYSLKKSDPRGIVCGLGNTYSSGCVELQCKVNPAQDYRFYWGSGTGSTWGSSQCNVVVTNLTTSWKKVKVRWEGSNRVVDVEGTTFSTTNSSTPGQILGPYADSLTAIWWDDAFFRKYAATEPSVSTVFPEESYGSTWLSGWSYRKVISIQGYSGAGIDYQVLLKVGESSGASNFDFHIEGHSSSFPSSKDDGGDLCFTLKDNNRILNFWVEKVEGSSPNRTAYCWVKISEDLNLDVDICCYYGNSSALNFSNGSETFLLFDDFSGASLNSLVWSSSSGISVSNDSCTIQGDSSNSQRGIKSKHLLSDSIEIRAFTKRSGSGDLDPAVWFYNAPISGSVYNPNSSSSTGVAFWYTENTGGAGIYLSPTKVADSPIDYTSTTWTSLSFIPKSGALKGSIGTSECSSSSTHTFKCEPVTVTLNSNASLFLDIDWLFVRKFQSNEPSFSLSYPEEYQGPQTWLVGWQFRKSHVIQAASGAGTNYQVRIVVHYGAGTDSGENVYLHNACKSDFGDIRFTASNGATALPYWMESKIDSDKATFWVRIYDDLSNSDVTIYIYYGNSSASYSGNGRTTFLVFEDMELEPRGDLLNDAYFDSANKFVRLTRNVDNVHGELDYHDISAGVVVDWKHWTGNGDGADACYVYVGTTVVPTSEDHSADGYIFAVDEYQDQLQVNFNGSHLSTISQSNIDNSTWHDVRIIIYKSGSSYYYKFYYGDFSAPKIDSSSTNEPLGTHFGWGARTGSRNNTHEIKDLIVRKYASPEPTHGSWGEVENASASFSSLYFSLLNRITNVSSASKNYILTSASVNNSIFADSKTTLKNKIFKKDVNILLNRFSSGSFITFKYLKHWDGPEGDYRFITSSTERKRPWWWWPYSRSVSGATYGQEGINYSRAPKSKRFNTFAHVSPFRITPVTSTPYTRSPEDSYSGLKLEKPRYFFWDRVYVVPTKIDFGFTKIGSSRQIYILHRYEYVSHDLQSVSISDPSFSVTLPETLPFTMAPGCEMQGYINVAQVGAVKVTDSPIYFHFDTVGDAICYVSATFAIVLLKPQKYDQWKRPHTFQRIKFKFETQLIHNFSEDPVRVPKLYYPVRSSSLQLGGVEEGAYDLDYDAINAARYLVVVPEFPLRVRLTGNAAEHDTQITVEDTTDFEVGYSAVLCSSQHMEAMEITEIEAGTGTLKFSGQLQYSYNTSDTWVYPSFAGFGHVKKTRSLVKHGVFNLEIDVDEIIPSSCNALTGTTSTWYTRPRTVLIEGAVVDSRDVKELDIGVPSIKNPLADRARDKIRVTHVYTFFNTDWRNFKDLFLYAKGRFQKVNIITWLGELQVYADTPAGSSSIKVRPRSYNEIWGTYRDIVIDYGTSTLETRVQSITTGSDYCVLSLQDNLVQDTKAGTPIHFKINAYLTEDEIEFDFQGDRKVCFVTVTWEESND